MEAMEEADARIAALAAQLFYEHGITATGVEALSKAAGISKRTLYERFGNKDGLITAAFQTLDDPVFERFTGAATRSSDDPRRQLERIFAELVTAVGSDEFRGCPFINGIAELTEPDHPAVEVVRRHKERMRRWMRDRARAAGATNPDLLSRQLMVVFEGGQAQSLVENSAKPARDALGIAKLLIDAAIPR
ncbi:MAG TPA: TetR/AcrR family transcriptional regulator [Acidothermaceae bacterium]|jgi:AcrR family transcriptional regulator